jgi:3'-phosphoadenosine 5'-phosphosulfate sulfotransferase (PAPS reductase)/FAD synthetase
MSALQSCFDFITNESATVPPAIAQLIERGALFVVNHSGGKDSQAMYLQLRDIVPADQLVLVHADLGRVEWAGAVAHIKATTSGEPLQICRARRDLLEMVAERGMFPSPEQRQCTSDLKRGPITKVIRHLTYARKAAGNPAWHLVVNCVGLRAEESAKRKKMIPFHFDKKNSKAGREWYEWLPVHAMDEATVYATIAAAGQEPHIVYRMGMKRFSCVFCIYADDASLKRAAELVRDHPELVNDPHVYRNYAALERSTGQVMMMPTKTHGRRSLEQITGIPAEYTS